MAMSGPAKTVAQTVSVVLLMGGLAWASVPFYGWFCRVTGFGGTPQQVERASDEILDQTIKVRFDGTLNNNMAWEFKPVVREMEVRIGEMALAFYEAHNPTSRPIAGQASYNVTPYTAGAFFDKVDCFCFTEQVLAPAKPCRCRSASLLTPILWTIRTENTSTPSRYRTHFTKMTCQRGMPPSIRRLQRT